LFLGEERLVRLLGVTKQLVGVDWLHSAAFHYSGSIGPFPVSERALRAFERLGGALHTRFELRGLFGVDCILRDDVPYPVEVNPRYTASVEVLEHATGVSALALHGAVFDWGREIPKGPAPPASTFVGKAILFARESITFPSDGPWTATLRQPGDVW